MYEIPYMPDNTSKRIAQLEHEVHRLMHLIEDQHELLVALGKSVFGGSHQCHAGD